MARAEPGTLRLEERDAQAVVLVRAVEEIDRRGLLLPLDTRREASRRADGEEATGAEGDPAWWSYRARSLLAELETTNPHLARLLALSRPARGLMLPLLLVALVLGLGTQALGPEKRVSLLALPLFALLAWNIVSLLFLGLRRYLPVGGATGGLVERLGHWWGERLQRQAEELAGRRRPAGRTPGDDRKEPPLAEALGRYLELWLPLVAPLAQARLRRLLHGSAWMVVAGAVAGMYFRGLVWEYRVTWESTFLAAETLEVVLGTLLAPAAALLGVEVPAVAPLRAPASGDAGPWIHLWATTAALCVGLPRGLVWLIEHWRASRLGRRLPVPLDEGYRRRLRSARDLAPHRLEIVPYSHRPSQKSWANLEGLLHDLVGLRSEIRRREPVAYGEPPPKDFDGRLRVVVFNLAQTPELEVHGEWLTHGKDGLIEGQAFLILVDTGPYRRRLGTPDPRRIEERQKGWRRVVASAGLQPLVLDLEAEPAADLLARLAAATWPEGALEQKGASRRRPSSPPPGSGS